MSLATRCPACGTVFRVVQDQLRVSEGWVRCGRCEDVFNALEGLFDLERDAPPAWTVSGSPLPPEPSLADTLEAAPAPAAARAPADEPTPSELGVQSTLILEDSVPPSPATDDDFGPRPPAPAGAPAVTPMTFEAAQVSFLRRAERAARWRRPRVRASLALLALLLAGTLAAQVGVRWHDEGAARWPAAAPLFGMLCEVAGCELEAPRRLDALAVDSSGLVKLDDANVYRLSVVLRNRDRAPVLLPAIELTLTDTQGRVLARRVLQPGELGARQPSLAGGAELALQGLLAGGERRLAGYGVELFYP